MRSCVKRFGERIRSCVKLGETLREGQCERLSERLCERFGEMLCTRLCEILCWKYTSGKLPVGFKRA